MLSPPEHKVCCCPRQRLGVRLGFFHIFFALVALCVPWYFQSASIETEGNECSTFILISWWHKFCQLSNGRCSSLSECGDKSTLNWRYNEMTYRQGQVFDLAFAFTFLSLTCTIFLVIFFVLKSFNPRLKKNFKYLTFETIIAILGVAFAWIAVITFPILLPGTKGKDNIDDCDDYSFYSKENPCSSFFGSMEMDNYRGSSFVNIKWGPVGWWCGLFAAMFSILSNFWLVYPYWTDIKRKTLLDEHEFDSD